MQTLTQCLVSRKQSQDSGLSLSYSNTCTYPLLCRMPSICVWGKSEENQCPRHLCIPQTSCSMEMLTLCLNKQKGRRELTQGINAITLSQFPSNRSLAFILCVDEVVFSKIKVSFWEISRLLFSFQIMNLAPPQHELSFKLLNCTLLVNFGGITLRDAKLTRPKV